MEVGADKDRVGNTGAKPLYSAAERGHLDVVRHLVEVGADKDQSMNSGATPLCALQLKMAILMVSASNRLRRGLPRTISHSCPVFPVAGWHQLFFSCRQASLALLKSSSYGFIIEKHPWSISTMTDGSLYLTGSRSSCTHATYDNTTWVCILVGTSTITLGCTSKVGGSVLMQVDMHPN